MTTNARPYRSRRRQEQAAQTKRAILLAARGLFAEHGYTSTSIDRIAQEAGVAVQTVYAVYRSKPTILAAALELVDEEGDVAGFWEVIRQEPDPVAILALLARIARTLNERCGDIIRVVYFAAEADPVTRPIWAEGQRRHRAAAEEGARTLHARGAFAASVDLQRVADIIDYFTSPQSFQYLVGQLGWSLDAAEAWVATTMQGLVLGPPPAPIPPAAS